MPQFSVQTVVGYASLSLGVFVMLGWLLRVPLMVQSLAGYTVVVFNTALCFAFAGLGIMLFSAGRRRAAQARTLLGCAIVVLTALVLAQTLTGIRLGIDWAPLHQWMNPGTPVQGRMAPNTALGFLCVGLLLVLAPRARNSFVAGLVQALIVGVLAIGLAGVVGYALNLNFLYGWSSGTRMAPVTACGLTLLGGTLWLAWQRTDWYQAHRAERAASNIVFIAAAVLVIVAVSAGIGGFAMLQSRIERSIIESLLSQTRSRAEVFAGRIDAGVEAMTLLSSRPAVAESMAALAATPSDEARYRQLELIARTLLPLGYQGIVFSDDGGRTLLPVGQLAESPQARIPLKAPHEAALWWDKQHLILNMRTEIFFDGARVGAVAIQRRLPDLTQALFNPEGLGETGEASVCAGLDDKHLQCLPNRKMREPFTTPIREASGQLSLSGLALGGQGTATTVDAGNQSILAAYAPVGQTGLGVVLKMETTEVFQPIREQLHFLLPLLALLVLAGTLLLGWQVRPLVEELSRSQRAAQQSEARLRAITNNMPMSIAYLDKDQRVRFVNKFHEERFGRRHAQLTGRTLQEILGDTEYEARRIHVESALRGVVATTERRETKGDSIRIVEIIYVPDFDESNQVVGFYAFGHDVTDRKSNEQRLETMALQDPLTGIANKRLLVDRVSLAVAHARRGQTAMAVLYLDLDGFKQVNDTQGHDAGDALLTAVAQRLLGAVRGEDTVARLGGDEFALALWHVQDTGAALGVAAKVVEIVSQPYDIDGRTVCITVSAGVAIYPQHGTDAATLLKGADTAMYAAKNSGKNGYKLFAGGQDPTNPRGASVPSGHDAEKSEQ